MSELVGRVTASADFTITNTVEGVTGRFRPSFSYGATVNNGTGLDQANMLWYDNTLTISGSGTSTVDLSGSVADAFQTTVSLTTIKGVFIANRNTTAGDIIEVGAGSNPFLLFKDATDVYELGPGGLFLVVEPSAAGHAVTAGTGDILTLTNTSSNDVVVDLAIWGVQ